MDCCCEQLSYVMACPCTDCTLWYYRFGKGPESIKRKRPLLVDVRFFEKNIELEQEEMIKKLKECNYEV